jgi:hypothetical protein
MAQATNVSTIILSRFHNFADPHSPMRLAMPTPS